VIRRIGRLISPLLFFALTGVSAQSAELRVAAASDLSFVLPEIVAGFEKQSGAQVKPSLGSSGNFAAQIQNGAPFDVFMAADISYPRKLIEAGFADAGTLFTYGSGRIVVWVPKTSKLDFEREGLRALANGHVSKIAIANPQHAPYGRAAVAALTHERIYEPLKPKLVLGENVSQAAQFVQSGNADAGIVALSLVLAPGMSDKGKYWVVPTHSYPPLEQAAVVMKSSTQPQLARAFIEYLGSPAAKELLRRYGFAIDTPKSRGAAQ
jgi:molybdate transport system substrate-binding protein